MDIERKTGDERLELWQQPPGVVVMIETEGDDLFLVTDDHEPSMTASRRARQFRQEEAASDVLCVDLAGGDLRGFAGVLWSKVVKAKVVIE